MISIQNRLKTILSVSIFLFISLVALAGESHLLPYPQKATFGSGHFVMGKVKLTTPVLQQQWSKFISEMGGTIDDKAKSTIEIRMVSELPEASINKEEAYRMTITGKKIEIEAISERGVYWAMQTLAQLRTLSGSKSNFKTCQIIDWPAFRVRGFMQDVGRSYVSLEELKREIAMLSRFKINVFHWHLTENQAWRLESKIFPVLNDSINTTRMPGKYYTLEEAKELVEFCKAHQVLLIPEIDMPGHSAAFVRAFRHNMQSPEGKKILKLLLDEICETFDTPYLHLGTDEAAFVDPLFVPEMVAYVRDKGKKVISWSPGWSYKPGEIDMVQLWSYRGKVQEGIPAIDSKFHYLNHFDTFGDIIALYNSKIYNASQGSEDLAGTILCVWNDRLVVGDENMVRQNHVYPNLLAIAERAWCGGGTEYYDKNGTILTGENSVEYKAFVDYERRMLWHKEHTFEGYPFAYVKQTNVRWNITDAFPNNGDLKKVFPPEQSLQNTYEYEGTNYAVRPAIGAGIYLRHVWGKTVSSFYKDPKENHTAYAYTWVYSPKSQEVGMWIEFQNYSRSESDLPPLQGTWDYRESRAWLNDQEVLPPTWSAVHRKKSNEIALGNENCVARQPITTQLNKGWNKVLLKLPVAKFSSSQVRLVKWMFTFVFVTPDGENHVDGLIYSPEKKMN